MVRVSTSWRDVPVNRDVRADGDGRVLHQLVDRLSRSLHHAADLRERHASKHGVGRRQAVVHEQHLGLDVREVV